LIEEFISHFSMVFKLHDELVFCMKTKTHKHKSWCCGEFF